MDREQRDREKLRRACERFVADIPVAHRYIISEIARRRGVPPYRVIAKALEEHIHSWLTSGSLEEVTKGQ